jgi:hypothetical protein
MLLHIRNAKRGRERYVMSSPILLHALRAYFKQPRPQGPRLELSEFVRAHGEAYRRTHSLSPEQHAVLNAIERCRTAALGGHLEVCTNKTRAVLSSCTRYRVDLRASSLRGNGRQRGGRLESGGVIHYEQEARGKWPNTIPRLNLMR